MRREKALAKRCEATPVILQSSPLGIFFGTHKAWDPRTQVFSLLEHSILHPKTCQVLDRQLLRAVCAILHQHWFNRFNPTNPAVHSFSPPSKPIKLSICPRKKSKRSESGTSQSHPGYLRLSEAPISHGIEVFAVAVHKLSLVPPKHFEAPRGLLVDLACADDSSEAPGDSWMSRVSVSELISFNQFKVGLRS